MRAFQLAFLTFMKGALKVLPKINNYKQLLKKALQECYEAMMDEKR